MISPLKQLKILIWKDLLIDLRRKESFLSMFLFSQITFLLFQFAFGENPKLFSQLLPGVYWVIVLLAGVLGLERAFSIEKEQGCMSALLISPLDRSVLFLGKMLATTVFLLLVQFFCFPIFFLLTDLSFNERSWQLPLVMLAGTLGFSAVGTLLSGMTAAVKGKEILLPLLLYPLLIPNLLSSIKITQSLLFPDALDSVWPWWKLLIGFDIVLGTLSFLSFEFVLEE